MSIIDKLISSIVPHVCLGCGYEGALICVNCAKTVTMVLPRCYRCRRPSSGFRICDDCQPTSNLSAVSVAVGYNGIAKELLWQLKFQSVQAAAETMVQRMMSLVDGAHDTWLVPVPTATKRARNRGYDQAKLLAKELARRAHLRYVDCLRRSGQTHQVGASREARLQQLQDSFRLNGSISVDQKIILVDDVVTTGATLEAAAAPFKTAGIQRVGAVTYAQPDTLGNPTAN